jgi:hypothetical protein
VGDGVRSFLAQSCSVSKKNVIHLAWICKMTSECNKYAFSTLTEVVICNLQVVIRDLQRKKVWIIKFQTNVTFPLARRITVYLEPPIPATLVSPHWLEVWPWDIGMSPQLSAGSSAGPLSQPQSISDVPPSLCQTWWRSSYTSTTVRFWFGGSQKGGGRWQRCSGCIKIQGG